MTDHAGRIESTITERWSVFCCRWEEHRPRPRVDHVITDPPYDEACHQGHELDVRDRAAVPFPPIDPGGVGPELIRAARRWVLAFCSDTMVGAWIDAAGGPRVLGGCYMRTGIWLKTNPCPQMSGDRPGSWGEPIAIMHRPGRARWNGGGKAGKWVHSSPHGDDRMHPTPKPVPLMLDLVGDFTDYGETIWDPYCGSGTTGVACLQLGRRFIGHEMDPVHYRTAVDRLRQTEAEIEGRRSRRKGQ